MSHEIEIDADRLDGQFAQFEAMPEGDPGTGMGVIDDEPQESEWLATLVFAFSFLNTQAPNWGVPPEQVHELAAKGALMMDQWFPSGPGSPEKLPPWVQFLVCLGGIVVAYGWDWQAMSLRPLTEAAPEDDPIEGEEQHVPVTPGRFSTMGSSHDDQSHS